MIRIEEFLFIQNIEQSQSESLIVKYPNLSFETSAEFFSYFESQGIRLTKKLPPSTIKDDTQILLDRLKEFKSSTDYDYVKKYIIREKIIEEAIQVGRIEVAKNEFDATVKEPLDPFFGFIVRKVLTGTENGVLPSENLQAILDEQNRNNTNNMSLSDLFIDVNRDDTGKIISFKNYLKNRGSISFNLVTERYLPRSFDYVVDKSFTSIPEAVEAERYVLEKAEEWSTDLNISTDEAVFLEKLKNLINEDSTSIPSLEAKLEKLQLQLNEAEEMQQNMSDTNDNLIEAIEQLSSDFNMKVAESEAKDSQIATLNETIDTTLSDLGTSVTSQIENAADAFDALSSKLEEQSKKAEEQAKAQLDAFKDGIGAIADAIKTSNSNTGNGEGGTTEGETTGSSTGDSTGGSTDGGSTNRGTGNKNTIDWSLKPTVSVSSLVTKYYKEFFDDQDTRGTVRFIESKENKVYTISDPYEYAAFLIDKDRGFVESRVDPQFLSDPDLLGNEDVLAITELSRSTTTSARRQQILNSVKNPFQNTRRLASLKQLSFLERNAYIDGIPKEYVIDTADGQRKLIIFEYDYDNLCQKLDFDNRFIPGVSNSDPNSVCKKEEKVEQKNISSSVNVNVNVTLLYKDFPDPSDSRGVEKSLNRTEVKTYNLNDSYQYGAFILDTNRGFAETRVDGAYLNDANLIQSERLLAITELSRSTTTQNRKQQILNSGLPYKYKNIRRYTDVKIVNNQSFLQNEINPKIYEYDYDNVCEKLDYDQKKLPGTNAKTPSSPCNVDRQRGGTGATEDRRLGG